MWLLYTANAKDSEVIKKVVIQKTRTVRVRVPYPHCTGAARTQIVDSMDTNTLRDTQKILKKIFFLNFSDLHAYIYLIFFQI